MKSLIKNIENEDAKSKKGSETVFKEKERRSGRNIPIKNLFLGELNERLDIGDIEGLGKSIKQVGVLEPLLVRPVGDRYEIIAGYRRYKAAQIAHVDKVPCIVKEMDDITALKASFHENEERKSASPLEYGLLCWKLARRCESLKEVADLLGKTQSWVESRINAYELYKKVNVMPIEKGSSGKYHIDDLSSRPTLGLVDANKIMQSITSPSVRRYLAKMGNEADSTRTSIVRELTVSFPKLTPAKKKKLIREFKKNPGLSIEKVTQEIIDEPAGIKVSISFNAGISKIILDKLENTGERPESWIRRVVIEHLDLDKAKVEQS